MFALLDVLSKHRDPISLKTLSEETQLHPSTAHRILNDLTAGGFVERPHSGHYRLGMKLLEYGNLVKARLNVREAALTPMQELQRSTGQSVNLSVRQDDEIVYIERTYSERSGMQVVRTVGGRAPLHLTSVGKLFLAHQDAAHISAYASRTGLRGNTRNSITDLDTLRVELQQTLAQGFARDNEELEIGVRCIACAIYNDQSSMIAGLSISAPAKLLEDEWSALLQQTARQISTALGYRVHTSTR